MSTPPPLGLSSRIEKLSRLRRTIARHMVQSLQISAQLTTVVEADFVHVSDFRQQVKAQVLSNHGVKLSILPFIAKAALEALPRNPAINASVDIEKGEATYYEARNLAIAVDTARGLVAPVIRDAEELAVTDLAVKIAALADTARAGKLMPDDLAGGTFTITNTGSRGALFDTPIINQPQVAILGAGAVVERPVAIRREDGQNQIAIRPMGYLSLSYDHRLVDGANAAQYLSDVKRLLQTPEWPAAVIG